MRVKISELKFCNKADNIAPLYYEEDLDALNGDNVETMVQIPAYFLKDGKEDEIGSVKVVVTINHEGKLMTGSNNMAALPCPPYCGPPPTKRMTLSSYLNQ